MEKSIPRHHRDDKQRRKQTNKKRAMLTVELLLRSIKEWNEVRKAHPDVKADLREANLSGAILSGADLSGADLSSAKLNEAILSRAILSQAILRKADLSGAILSGADLSGADLNEAILSRAILSQAILREAILSGANLSEANLSNANLSGADLSGADLSVADLSGANLSNANLSGAILSKCVINKHAIRSGKIYGCDKGVNGIYCSETDSAALMKLTPRGNSMHSSNPEAIIENLKGARKLHNITLSFAGICLLIGILKPKEIKLPLFSDFTSDQSHYIILVVLAVFLSIGIMSVAESFMRSALEGTQYINNQDAAMKVGHFPWMLSKYENGFLPKVQSLIMRTLLIFHPIVYVVVLYMQTPYDVKPFLPVNAAKILNVDPTMIWGIWSVYVILLALCIRIGVLSHKFQKPILFDPLTEKDRKTDAEILNETLSNIAELLKVKTTTETAKTKANRP